MDQLQMLREQFPADPSEIESHLLSHLASQLGGRDEGSHYGVEMHSERDDESEIDIKVQLKNVKISNAANVENGPKTRARPRKPHEPKPFLSIGNIPENRIKLDPIGVDYRQQSFVSNPNVPFNTPSRMVQSQNSNIRSVSVMSSEWNSMVPKRHKYSSGAAKDVGAIPAPNNVHVLAPFKHSVATSSSRPQRPLSPGESMKAKTVMATHMVAKVMAKQKPEPSPRSAGRLLKGKLKPMTPVSVQGPHMTQCRGIQPQGQMYTASPSRTLQRRRHILSTLVAKDILNAAKQPRPDTVESVHRTSVASSLDENRMEELKEDLEEANERASKLKRENTKDSRVQSRENTTLTEIKTVPKTPPVLPDPVPPVSSTHAIDSGIDPINVVRESNLDLTMAAIDQVYIDDKKQNSFFVTDQANEEEASKYTESESAERPKTAAESQRRVRFMDSQNEKPGDDVRRSKSAVARINEETSGDQTKKKKSAKKNQGEKGQGDNVKDTNKKPPDDDNKDGGQGNQGGNQGSPPGNQGNNGNQQQPDNNDCDNDSNQGNTNNNGNQERQQVLRMSINNMKEGFQNPEIADKRRRPMSGKPKSKLGLWEDTMKPDRHLQNLGINTRKEENALIEYNRINSRRPKSAVYNVSNSQVAFGRSRPVSAGPRSFKAVEKQKMIIRARPQSANMHDSDMRIESYGAQLNDRSQANTDRNQSDCTLENYYLQITSKKNKPSSVNKKKGYTDFRRGENENDAMYLSEVVQQTKAVTCNQCGMTSFKVREDFSSDCENCFQMGEQSKHQILEQNHSSNDENGLQINERKLQQDSDSSEKALDDEKTPEDLFMNMDQIEASLNEVKQQIRDCIEGRDSSLDHQERPQSRVSGFMESVLSMEEEQNRQNLVEQNEKVEKKHAHTQGLNGNLSQHVTGTGQNGRNSSNTNMTVYQYTELNNNINACPDYNGSGDVTADVNDKPLLGEKMNDGGGLHRTQGGKTVNGSITTYDVNLVKPAMEPVYMELMNGNQTQASLVPPSPYPPLCFHVNARPPEGHVYYFAYGIDMNPSRFSSYISREGTDRFWGLLFGFKLRFNKKGLDVDAGGFPNIEYEQNSSVEGALYLIRKEELSLLDNSMGYPEYVEKVMMPVWFLNCSDPDEMGVAQYCVPAVTYVARDTWTVKDTDNLSTEYAVRQCVGAADLLSPAYKEYIISQIS